MVLFITKQQIDMIYQHGQKTYPEECCGIILGYICRDKLEIEKTATTLIQTENVWNAENADYFGEAGQNSRQNRYAIAPQIMLQAQKTARDQSLHIIGIYHSHPDYSATPSEFDRSYAWPEYSYIIVSIEKGNPSSIYSWCLDDQHQFQSEQIHIQDIGDLEIKNQH